VAAPSDKSPCRRITEIHGLRNLQVESLQCWRAQGWLVPARGTASSQTLSRPSRALLRCLYILYQSPGVPYHASVLQSTLYGELPNPSLVVRHTARSLVTTEGPDFNTFTKSFLGSCAPPLLSGQCSDFQDCAVCRTPFRGDPRGQRRACQACQTIWCGTREPK
jgi:hypothetical protein